MPQVHTEAHAMDRMRLNIQVCDALLDVVQTAGRNGAPAGHMYVALCGMLSLDRFMGLMNILEKAGKVRCSGHVYYDASLPTSGVELSRQGMD